MGKGDMGTNLTCCGRGENDGKTKAVGVRHQKTSRTEFSLILVHYTKTALKRDLNSCVTDGPTDGHTFL